MGPRDAGDVVAALEDLKCSDALHEALWYLASLMLIVLHSLVESRQLFRFKDKVLGDQGKVTKCLLERGMSHVVFQEVVLTVMEPLEVCSPRRSTALEVEVEENWGACDSGSGF